MHLLPTDARSLDDDAVAVDLAQSPADIVALSFSDGDLAVLAAAHRQVRDLPNMRLASLARLKHPFSVDLYLDKVACKARFVLVRLLGGLDYWRYGVDELAAAARRHGFHLAIIPGCEREDARLDRASTLSVPELRRLWAYFQEGGAENLGQALRFVASHLGEGTAWAEPRKVPGAGLHAPFCRPNVAGAPHALIVFYRAALLAADVAPVAALADALRAAGARVSAFFVTSLKDRDAAEAVAALIAADPPDVVLNTTAFSARAEGGGTVLDRADAVVLQAVLSGVFHEIWAGSARGLGAADLAMNVVLPEVDGRVLAGAISFKGESERHVAAEFTSTVHRPEPPLVAHVAELALAWARLKRKPRRDRRLACVLSDYPGKTGRAGYAVGLDTPRSIEVIAERLRLEGFCVEGGVDGAEIMSDLTAGARQPLLSVEAYRAHLDRLPPAFTGTVREAWGDPAEDPEVVEGAFRFRVVRAGRMVLALQPDRGRAAHRRAEFHDPALPPRHGYLAFYLWLREVERIDALIHLGTHGTLEWLPGKAVALGEACAPTAVLGPLPVIYPFIVNDPGEAAQAKRRMAAVTIGHLTPRLMAAGSHGPMAELEALFDEYAEADGLDRRRARLLAGAILDRARDSGFAAECGLAPDDDPEASLVRLDAWLCDLKEARIGDGLHVFGGVDAPASDQDASSLLADTLTRACGEAELRGLVAALDGRFVEPGPSGSPGRGRLDVLPTGRNLYSVDPRSIPTRTAYEIGTRAARELLTRYAQDHGEWPQRIVLDLWGSATMRTGGDDLAQAFALMGVRPRWDSGSTRVSGFEILPQATLDCPRVDVTLRISGLFRDVFPDQIALFDAAVRAVAALDEADEDNALAHARRTAGQGAILARVFGAPPNRYGLGLAEVIASDGWGERDDLGRMYLAGSSRAFGAARPDGVDAPDAFRDRVRAADAFVHVQDLPEVDVLSSDTFAEHEGGFAAAAALLGAAPSLYHADATRPDRTRVRSLAEEVAKSLRARATNPRWIAGQMRHGYRGAAEIAETVDSLFALAATSDAVPSGHFDRMFDATLGEGTVRAFLERDNPGAARAIAGRFEQAALRGFWVSRRNSTSAILAELLGRS